jgi:antitoxin VapB
MSLTSTTEISGSDIAFRLGWPMLAYANQEEPLRMPAERHVKLFRNGRSQAVRIPREFELPGKEAVMRKEGSRIVIEPAPRLSSLVEYVATIEPQDFPEISDLPPEPVDIG